MAEIEIARWNLHFFSSIFLLILGDNLWNSAESDVLNRAEKCQISQHQMNDLMNKKPGVRNMYNVSNEFWAHGFCVGLVMSSLSVIILIIT